MFGALNLEKWEDSFVLSQADELSMEEESFQATAIITVGAELDDSSFSDSSFSTSFNSSGIDIGCDCGITHEKGFSKPIRRIREKGQTLINVLFPVTENSRIRQCAYCPKEYSAKSNSGTTWEHLEKFHCAKITKLLKHYLPMKYMTQEEKRVLIDQELLALVLRCKIPLGFLNSQLYYSLFSSDKMGPATSIHWFLGQLEVRMNATSDQSEKKKIYCMLYYFHLNMLRPDYVELLKDMKKASFLFPTLHPIVQLIEKFDLNVLAMKEFLLA